MAQGARKKPSFGHIGSCSLGVQKAKAAPPPAPGSKAEFQALVQKLRLQPSLARRLATAVDAEVAEEWATARAEVEESARGQTSADVPRPTGQQLWRLHVRTAVPFIGFGFFDNMIMITVGGTIESTIGVACGLSSLAAAGLGQMVSDASGITLQGLIERFADRLGLPHPGLSIEQQQLASVKTFALASRILGILLGCGIGMFPLVAMPAQE